MKNNMTKLVKENDRNAKEHHYFYRSKKSWGNNLPDYLHYEIDKVDACSNLKLKIDKLMRYYFLKTNSNIKLDINKDVLNRIDNDYLIDYTESINHELISFTAKTQKMVVGLGTESLRELGITLHHVYGIPYIPGQGIKGMFRNYIINEYYSSEEEALGNELFSVIFGSNSQQGKVNFYDAFPVNVKDIMGLDIMTPHYNNYYQNNKPPTDDDKLSPNKFIIVKDAKFKFNISIEKTDRLFTVKDNDTDKPINLYTWLVENLNYALNYQGVGGKTSVGYGFFDINDDDMDKLINCNRTTNKHDECSQDTANQNDIIKDNVMYEINKIIKLSLGEKFNHFFEVYTNLDGEDKIRFKDEMDSILDGIDKGKLNKKNAIKYEKYKELQQ